MEKYILQNDSPAERQRYLADSAYKISNEFYSKKLTEDEMTEKRRLYSQGAVKLQNLDAELARAKEQHKTESKPIKNEMSLNLQHIKTGFMEVEEDLYLIDDQEEGMMGYYNSLGELVRTRPLHQNERQLRMNLKQA